MRALFVKVAVLSALTGCTSGGEPPEPSSLEATVLATERAFARTMVDRDHPAFTTFLAEEAIFFSGEEVIRGRDAVASAWAPFFEGPTPPFTWEPSQVHVLDSGSLALSTGPVYGPDGTVTANFNSIWRQEEPGVWKIVFDKGSAVCACPGDAQGQ